LDGAGNVVINDGAGNPLGVNLTGIADDARSLQKAEWAKMIAEELEMHAHAVVERAELVGGGSERVRSLLVPVLNLEASTSQEYDPTVRHLGGGFVARLGVRGLRVSTGAHVVHADDVRRWGADPNELWAIAMHNLRRTEHEVRSVDSSGKTTYAVAGGFFNMEHLLRLDELLDTPTPYGVLVAAPRREFWLFHPIRGGHALMFAVESFPTMIGELSNIATPFSDRIYWWAEGHLEAIAIRGTPSDGAVNFEGSQAFSDAFNGMLQACAEDPTMLDS